MEAKAADLYGALSGGKTARFDEKLVELLTSTAKVFAEQGYEKASMRKVARAVGISLSSLYYYVSCKEELLFLIQYHTFGVLSEALEAIVEKADEPEAQLAEMVSSHVRYLVQHLPELKVCTTELDSLKGDYYQHVLKRRQRYFELTRNILERLRTRDHRSTVEPNLGALYLFGMLNWLVMWFDPRRNDPAELSESLVAFFLVGYQGGAVPDGTTEKA
jgi:AcrR family transcriptional regulator